MKNCRRLTQDQSGIATIEAAFALPILLVMIFMMFQFAYIYRAISGIQHALGQGARYATLCLSPTTLGCTAPTAANIKNVMNNSVYGIGPGTFTVPTPSSGSSGTGNYFDLTVSYTQPTDLVFFTGPTVTVTRSKRVWVAGT